jgi:hypothetical protein
MEGVPSNPLGAPGPVITTIAGLRLAGLSATVIDAGLRIRPDAPTLAIAALCVLCAHVGGSILWVFSTVLLQLEVPDRFRGRVFAAELAFVTLVTSLSSYWTAAGLDRHGWSPRALAFLLGALAFLLSALVLLLSALVLLLGDLLWCRDDCASRGEPA